MDTPKTLLERSTRKSSGRTGELGSASLPLSKPKPKLTLFRFPQNFFLSPSPSFPTDFPNSINFTVGQSDEATDFNYVHWSRYGGSYTRLDYVVDNVNVWQVNFEVSEEQAKGLESKTATLTIQLVRSSSSTCIFAQA
jgi:hypothetical protein